jgi:hypothetical protein
MVDDLASRASPVEPELQWIQAEHRVHPELLHAQTSLAQGAAGIGLILLKLDALEEEGASYEPVSLPDSPYDAVPRRSVDDSPVRR